MKKTLALVLSVLMLVSLCVSFASCGSDDKDTSSTADSSNASTDASTDNSATTDYSDLKVGAIYITSQNDTAGYTFAHHNGITKGMQTLGIPSENLLIIDNVPEDDILVTNAIDTLAGQGCDIIFGISFGYIEAFAAAAEKEEYKDIIFSHATGYKSNDKNFNNYFGRIYQARYLAGIAAGLKTLELKNNNIGYVAAWGTEYAETCSGINAFALGAQSVNPDAIVHVKQISTWGDEALEKSAAEALINTFNCCVIAQHCDSAQPQLAAAAANVFGCGYNSDMTVQAPAAHLTAPVWNWEIYYALAMKTAKEDPANFMTVVGNYYGGLKEGFVDISALSENCSEGTEAIINAVKALIVSGEWDVFSGVKLSYEKQDDGTYKIVKTDSALKTNTDTEIVAAGGASVEDGVITGSMNYYLAGVQEN